VSGAGDDMRAAMRTEAYLRNELSADDRASFERDVLRDPALRAELELERRIDDRLRAMYAPPSPVALAGAPGENRRPAGWVRAAMGIAAVLAVAAGVHFSGVLRTAPGGTKADAVLARLERTGFEPAWLCRDDAEFAQFTRARYGQAFTVASAPGMQVVGWQYCSGVLGDEAGVMMVKFGETERAIVVVDKREHDRPVEVDPASGLRVHRKKIGGAVLYEVSGRDTPAVLPLVHAAD